jgi:hypothetical protein
MMQVIDIDGPQPVFDPWQEVLTALPPSSDADLTFSRGGRTVMIGRVMGSAGQRRPRPYREWSEREAARIRQAGACTVVGVVGLLDANVESHVMATSLRAIGGTIDGARSGRGFITWRVCFPEPRPS